MKLYFDSKKTMTMKPKTTNYTFLPPFLIISNTAVSIRFLVMNPIYPKLSRSFGEQKNFEPHLKLFKKKKKIPTPPQCFSCTWPHSHWGLLRMWPPKRPSSVSRTQRMGSSWARKKTGSFNTLSFGMSNFSHHQILPYPILYTSYIQIYPDPPCKNSGLDRSCAKTMRLPTQCVPIWYPS